jgi:dTDP-4-dehydrorhamnose reductase
LLKDQYKIDIEIEPYEDFKIDRSLNSEKFRKAVGFQPKEWKKMVGKMIDDPFTYEKYK